MDYKTMERHLNHSVRFNEDQVTETLMLECLDCNLILIEQQSEVEATSMSPRKYPKVTKKVQILE